MKITWVLSTQNPNKLVSMKRPAFCKLTGPIECTNFVYLYLTESQGWALVKAVTRARETEVVKSGTMSRYWYPSGSFL